jgi:eukaryotic-like serine/threonine-protein kinase
MPLGPGTRRGPYEVIAAIGAGGMGEVYRARDSRLGRDVAIKVLPDSFASDPDRLARFEREAQLLASLNHQNIATIHGLEDGPAEAGPHTRALVMELVDGPTLADRIAQGAMPLDEAPPIARQIAEALEAAHERGIIHRDLKPANIKLTPSGQVKVLDFGLAKMLESAGSGQLAAGSPNLTVSPTISIQATYAGVILGTAAYMSPEQARGKPADRRADIWAFGCVLFEMLTGKQAFEPGETVSDAVAAILTKEPDWTALPKETPGNIRTLLRRCLQKEPNRRLPHIGSARIELEEPTAPAIVVPPIPSPASRPRFTFSWPAAVVAIVAMSFIYSALPWLQDDPPPGGRGLDAPEMRTEIVTPSTPDPTAIAISPDGRQMVFVASGDGPSRLWLRSLSSSTAQPLAGTEGAMYPFWSGDSRSVAFAVGTKLERFDLGASAPKMITDVPNTTRGGTWNKEGTVLFAVGAGSLATVSAAGGQATQALEKLEGQNDQRFPQFLPDGRHFLFFAVGPPNMQGIYLGSLDSKETKRLTAADTAGRYVASEFLIWVQAGTLVAQRIDVQRGELVGSRITIADSVGFDANLRAAAFSVSETGLIAYRSGTASRRQLVWFDRTGKSLGVFGGPDEAAPSTPRISPDGRRVAVYRVVQGNADIWLLDGTRTTRLTFDAALDRFPLWSPDGTRIVFDSNRKGTRDFYVKSSNGTGSEELLFESPADKAAYDWSPDSRFILFRNQEEQTGRDIWVLPLDGRKPWVFLKASFDEHQAHFSPDGRWVVYASNESGREEIYVRPFVPQAAAGSTKETQSTDGTRQVSGQWQVSTAGGIFPRWSKDGRELYYLGPLGEIMAASVRVTDTTFDVGTPVKLFDTHIYGGGVDANQGRQYDVTSDGRFLINTVLDEAPAPITILQNWKPPSN